MFTPPPSPLPRMHQVEHPLDAVDPLSADGFSEFLLPPPVSSPSSPSHPPLTPPHELYVSEKRRPSPTASVLNLPHPPPSKAQPLLLPVRSKKAKGRRIVAAVILAPLLLVCVTIAYHRCMLWRTGDASVQLADARLHWLDALGLAWVPDHRRPKRQDPQSGSLSMEGPTATATGDAPADSATIPLVPPATPPAPVPNPFPQPFDVSLSSNFSSASCQTFFTNFTQDLSFRACRSFGLLLDSSNAFFMAETNLTTMNNIVWGTCNTRLSQDDCVSTMSTLADTLRDQCEQDLAANIAIVQNALAGFESYQMYRQAGCLIDESTNEYCYVKALAASSPADAYFYSLGLGIAVPNGTAPSCSQCARDLMTVYAGVAGATTLPISRTYTAAQNATVAACGSGYATPVNVLVNGNAAHSRQPVMLAIAAAALFVVALL